ncbi:4'-phosphopantetheinyl transferase superfamily protein [Actinoplanes sp. KI2]|uniref:4'-phosphopantetheinyl transferase family protein n=1 Tax=Actinoplanes sp. KI2 TaxID=2983315 RepID=UPI0021D5C122|nr:4'-phosphopantetheinyl transferase superfamily protein [Actinoplanes sp. KI2]MCU7729480.1 4'-phosphopantetheinyl transferase superfamily protein [Actinoplanes sp. KI2]
MTGEAPRWLALGEDALPDGSGWLSSAEAERAAGRRHRKRHTEYLLRRLVAKRAVAAVLGRPVTPVALAGVEVANAPGGAPEVFVDGTPAGLDVSISDRAGWAVCVVGRGVGCDLELVEPRSPGFVRDFLTGSEQRLVAEWPPDDEGAPATLIWSAKESALKALRTGLDRDTRQVEVSPGAAASGGWAPLTVRVAEGCPLTGWWRRYGRFVLTMAGRTASLPPVALGDPAGLAAASPRHSWLDRPLR